MYLAGDGYWRQRLRVVVTNKSDRLLQGRPAEVKVGDGPGEVRATLNHLDVRGTAGGSMVLKYHWLETLRCRPGCRLRRVTVPGDRVGFIGVENAPPDFEIYNGY